MTQRMTPLNNIINNAKLIYADLKKQLEKGEPDKRKKKIFINCMNWSSYDHMVVIADPLLVKTST